MVNRLHIEEFLSQAQNHPVIDVRSPAEFEHAHIPGAISLPLFSDEERASVGTAYKKEGREKAMMLGLDFYGKNMQRIITDLKLLTGDKQLYVHCWRGGMRSGVVAWMLDLFGYKVSTLIGGYKSFRIWALNSFELPKEIVMLGGKTGSGKTEVLDELRKNGEQVIDLEALAHHKGSAFGDLGEKIIPTQEQFENDLAMEFSRLDPSKHIWLEDESQRIGWVNLPNSLWKRMREANVFYLEIPFEERLEFIVENYGKFERKRLALATLRIQKRLGGLATKTTVRMIEENNLNGAFSILLKYYDKWYSQATQLRNKDSIFTVPLHTVSAATNGAAVLQTAKSKMKVKVVK